MSREVVITGAGAVVPSRADADAGAVAGGVPSREPVGFSAAPADELAAWLAALPAAVRARATRAERVTQLALLAACRALADAALEVPADPGEPRRDVGIVLGTAFGCFLTNAAFQQRLAAEGMPGASPRLFAATVSNAAAGELAIACRLGGPLLTVSAGGASGLVALAEAVELVRHGRATAVVAGGMDASDPPLARWLAEQGWPAARAAAGMLVCEDAAHAAARAARARGTIVGCGSAFEPCAVRASTTSARAARSRASDPRAAALAGAPPAGGGLRAAIDRALAVAGAGRGDLALVVSAPSPWRAALGTPALDGISAPRRSLEAGTLAATGPLGVLAALADTPPGALALIVDVCESGHVAAVVLRSAGS